MDATSREAAGDGSYTPPRPPSIQPVSTGVRLQPIPITDCTASIYNPISPIRYPLMDLYIDSRKKAAFGRFRINPPPRMSPDQPTGYRAFRIQKSIVSDDRRRSRSVDMSRVPNRVSPSFNARPGFAILEAQEASLPCVWRVESRSLPDSLRRQGVNLDRQGGGGIRVGPREARRLARARREASARVT